MSDTVTDIRRIHTVRRAALTRIATILSFSAVLLGCENLQYRPEAVGPEGEIVVVIDSVNWNGPVGESLREQLSPWVGTLPAPEPLFTLRQLSITSESFLSTIQSQKNIVFAAPIAEETPEAAFIRSRLDEAGRASIMDGRSTVVERRDLWRRFQQVFYIMSATPEGIISTLEDNGEGIRYTFNTIARERTTRDIFSKGRQPEIEQTLMDGHGFAVNAQHDFQIAIDTTNFVWLRRIVSSDSWRSIFVSYVDNASPNSLTPEWIYQARERLTESWITGNLGGFVAIDFRRELQTENIDFLGRYGYETRGLWHMLGRDADGERIEYGMGGAFVNYAFYDEESSRIYMIDGMVFAPGYAKREFVRDMEAIAYTFRTSDDVASQEAAQAGM